MFKGRIAAPYGAAMDDRDSDAWGLGTDGTFVETFVPPATVNGTPGNDFIHVSGDGLIAPPNYNDIPGATNGDDLINPMAGDDVVHAGGGSDDIKMQGNLTAADQLDGGDGIDTVELNGNYGGGVTFNADTFQNIEQLNLAAGYSYKLVLADGDARGTSDGWFEVFAGTNAGDTVYVDDSAETNGNIDFQGGSGNDTFIAGAGRATFDLESGGSDTAIGGTGDNNYAMGAALSAGDHIDGTLGKTDEIFLDGDYSHGVTLGAATIVSIDDISLNQGHSYSLTMNDGNVAAGATLAIYAEYMNLADTFALDASAEKDGNYTVGAALGGNTILLGAGSDYVFYQDGVMLRASDRLDGGAGVDRLLLWGDYSAGLTFGASTMINFEKITLGPGYSYKLVMNDANLAAHMTMTIDGSAMLGLSYWMNVDARAEVDGNYVFIGSNGDDILFAGGGNDTFVMGASLSAGDHLDGGTGLDTVTLNGDYSAGLTFSATTMVNVETLTLAAGHSYSLTTSNATVAAGQTLTVDGSALGAANTLIFNGGYETDGKLVVLGGAGADTLKGGRGDDTLSGGLGNDGFTANNGGNDTINGGDGNDTVGMGAAFTAADKIDGGADVDTIALFGDYSAGLTFAATTMVNVETLSLAAGHSYKFTLNNANVAAGQTLTVDASALGAANSLTLTGSAESDGYFAIKGGAGADVIAMGAMLRAADKIDGGAGTDRVVLNGDYSAGFTFSATTMVNVETLTLLSGHSYNLTTSNANVAAGQTLTIDGSGLSASDALIFNGGYETDGKLVVLGGAGADTLKGDTGDDTLTGGAGDDGFTANNGGNDTINGGDGNDMIGMGAAFTAADHINGGAGTDTVVLNGDYSAGIVFGATTMTGVELISLGAGHSYKLVTDNATVSSGLSLAISGGSLQTGDTLIFNGSAESDGRFAITAGAGNDVLTGGAGADQFDLSKGGVDTVLGSSGNDTFTFGAALTAADKIDGGADTDKVVLNGDYSAGLTFSSTTMVNVETLQLLGTHGYALTTSDATVAAGQVLTVTGNTLTHALTFDGSAEQDGSFVVTGGKSDDTLIGGARGDTLSGGAGNDTITGGGGGDVLSGGSGHNSFVYNGVADSTGPGFDTVDQFNVTSDTIDLWFQVAKIDSAVSGGTLRSGQFDSDLAAAIGAGQLQGDHAVLFTPNAGDYVGETFLIVDANGIAGYQAGQDLVIAFDHTAHLDHFKLTDFTI